jgi:hypothetical protein
VRKEAAERGAPFAASSWLKFGFALQYSLLYLQSFVKDVGLGEPFAS